MRFVEHSEDFDAALVRIDQGFGDWCRGEGIGLHEDLLRGSVDLPRHGVCGATLGGEVHRNACASDQPA